MKLFQKYLISTVLHHYSKPFNERISEWAYFLKLVKRLWRYLNFSRLQQMRRAIACRRLKHWRYAKKLTLCVIKKTSRCVADRTSKTTSFFIFHFLQNTKILQENQVYLFVISLVQGWKLYYQKQRPEVCYIKRCS